MNLINYYRTMPSKSKAVSLLIFIYFLGVVKSPSPFCYINCSPTNCQSDLATACNLCATNYVLLPASSPNSCVFDTTLTTKK